MFVIIQGHPIGDDKVSDDGSCLEQDYPPLIIFHPCGIFGSVNIQGCQKHTNPVGQGGQYLDLEGRLFAAGPVGEGDDQRIIQRFFQDTAIREITYDAIACKLLDTDMTGTAITIGEAEGQACKVKWLFSLHSDTHSRLNPTVGSRLIRTVGTRLVQPIEPLSKWVKLF